MQLINLTPFDAQHVCLIDESGAETLVIVVKATYQAVSAGGLELAEMQVPIALADEYYGEPGESSLRQACDICLRKVGADIVLVGHVCASDPELTQVDVSVKVGTVGKKVRVFGDREWRKSWGILTMTEPLPVHNTPLVFERAFGGADPSPDSGPEFEPFNPVGVGFRSEKTNLSLEGVKLPNVEDPDDLISEPYSKPKPAGFGFVAPNWEPRVQFAGTYDEAWRKGRMPLLPQDFDGRFFSTASPGLSMDDYLHGDEPVQVKNAGASSSWEFQLPGDRIEAVIDLPDAFEIIPLDLDTLVLDADKRQVTLTWRGQMKMHGIVFEIGWVKTQFAGGVR